jgi:hypothetical protein
MEEIAITSSPIRQVRTFRNPEARGFIVKVLERDEGRLFRDADGTLIQSTWKTIHSQTAGTKRKADKIHGLFSAEYL